MGINYAPFDDPVAPKPPLYIKEPLQALIPIHSDGTECNYLIMFFVAGVFLMGLIDLM